MSTRELSPHDTIELRGIRVFGRHGANPGEQDVPQPFEIDLWLDCDLLAASMSDDLADTLDYAEIHARLTGIVRERRYRLLERLGREILDALFVDPRIAAARVSIAKPNLLAGATPVVTLRAVNHRR